MDLLMELLDATASRETAAATASLRAPDAPDAARTDPTWAALRFITCGSVDDGKSTLIGRLLLDSRNVLQDQLANVSRGGAVDLAQFTDGLSAEREQGITIDVAYRYFSTARRKFIIGDTPGHEQYTRNMVTAASNADAAVVLVDATKLPWHAHAPDPGQQPLLPQTRRHSLLAHLLRVPAIVFAVNKLDAVAEPALAFANIERALQDFAAQADIPVAGIVPISALHGNNVVQADPGWCGYHGPTLLHLLEQLPATASDDAHALAVPVQWVEKLGDDEGAHPGAGNGQRVLWGRVATGRLAPGQKVVVVPGGQSATVAQVLDHTRRPATVSAGQSAGVVLDRALDVSRGDWLLAHGDDADTGFETRQELPGTVAWLDDAPMQPGRSYWAVHGHRWVKARVTRITHQLDVHTLERREASELGVNAIGEVVLQLQSPIVVVPYTSSRALGALVLVDTASHRTAGAVLLH